MAKTKLTCDQLLAIRHAIDFLLSHHERLRWSFLELMSKEEKDRESQFKVIDNLMKESRNLEDARKTVSKIYEEQFEDSKGE